MISKILLISIATIGIVIVGIFLITLIIKYLFKQKSEDNELSNINQSICITGLLVSFGIMANQTLLHLVENYEIFSGIIKMPNNTITPTELYQNIGAELFITILFFVFNAFLSTVLSSFLKKENILGSISTNRSSSIIFSTSCIVLSIIFLSLFKVILAHYNTVVPSGVGLIPNIN